MPHSTDTWPRDLFRVVLAVLFPPIGVWLRVRFTAHFLVSILLTLFGYLPGLIHALWVLTRPCGDLWPHRHR